MVTSRPENTPGIGLGDADGADIPPLEPHVGLTRQYWRDIILGVNDGLVSMLLLVAGVVGGGMDRGQVVLTGIAGAVAGSISMAAGEYLATRSQEQVLDAELALERTHIRYHRDQEVDQLRDMFTEMGIGPDDIESTVAAFVRDDETLLNAMKSLEFGAVDSERRSPYRAMAFSGLLFLVGALAPVTPFLIASDTRVALIWAGALTSGGLFGVGVAKTAVTRGNRLAAGAENLVIAGIGGVAAYFIGEALGTNMGA